MEVESCMQSPNSLGERNESSVSVFIDLSSRVSKKTSRPMLTNQPIPFPFINDNQEGMVTRKALCVEEIKARR